MKHHYATTYAFTIVVAFALLVLSAITLTTHSTFTTIGWRFNEVQATPMPQEDPQRITSSVLAKNLSLVFNVANQIGDPETLEAILLQETNGGRSDMIGNKDSPVGKRSYGLMQVQVVAARDVLRRNHDLFNEYFPNRKYDNVADEEIIALLLTDPEANVKIAAYHFRYYKTLAHGNWDRTVAGYNAGIVLMHSLKRPSEFKYVVGVREKLTATVRPFNREHGLQLTQRF